MVPSNFLYQMAEIVKRLATRDPTEANIGQMPPLKYKNLWKESLDGYLPDTIYFHAPVVDLINDNNINNKDDDDDNDDDNNNVQQDTNCQEWYIPPTPAEFLIHSPDIIRSNVDKCLNIG